MRQRPSGPVTVNWGSPLAKGLVSALKGDRFDAVQSLNWTLGSNTTITSSGYSTSTNGLSAVLASVPLPVTMMVRSKTTSASTQQQLISHDQGSGGFGLRIASGGGYQWIFNGVLAVSFTGFTTDTNWKTFLVTCKAATGDTRLTGWLWSDTWSILSSVSSDSSTVSGTPTALRVGTRYGATDPFNGVISDALYWNRALTDLEVRELYLNPWGLYVPAETFTQYYFLNRPAIIVDEGGSPYSLSAETISYVLAGTDINVRVTRTLAGGSGSFALTGSDAAFNILKFLAAESGTFNLSGTNAGLISSRILAGASGAYTLSGTDITTKASRLIAGGSGAFSLSGTDAVVKASRLLTGGSGSFTLSGTDSVLKAARMLVGGSGAFVLTGLDISLVYTPLTGRAPLIAESGAFVLSGTDLNLKISRKVAAESGAFSFTGTNVNFSRRYNLVATAGDFVLTATDVAFSRSYVLSAGAESYLLRGQGAVLTYSGQVSPESYIRLNSPLSDSLVSLLTQLSDAGTVTITLSPMSEATGSLTDSLKDE